MRWKYGKYGNYEKYGKNGKHGKHGKMQKMEKNAENVFPVAIGYSPLSKNVHISDFSNNLSPVLI